MIDSDNDFRKWSDNHHFGAKSNERFRHWPSSIVHSPPPELEETVEAKSNQSQLVAIVQRICVFLVAKQKKSQIIGSGKETTIVKSLES
jgi:hypothetical protein